jgi:putative protease
MEYYKEGIMKLISFALTTEHVDLLISHGVQDIIVSCAELSRFHQNNLETLLSLTNYIKKKNAKVILEWDVLYPENTLPQALSVFERLPLHDYSAIRVQDPGLVFHVKNNYPWLPIQLILETGNHNLIGLKTWEEYLGKQLEKLILSNELSREHLKSYAAELKTPIEVLIFGRILLFYGPRKLLSPVEKSSSSNDYITAIGTSEESPHSGFPLIENRHGTFMFNVKDLSLMDHLQELDEIGISFGRVDLRFDNSIDQIGDLLSYKGPRPLIKGFYQINKTDVLFSKLKNKKTNRTDKNFIGVVVDVERDKGIAILVKCKNFTHESDSQFKIITPEGKEKILQRFSLRNSSNETIQKAKEGDIVICSFINGVSVKSQVYSLATD